MDSKRLNAFLKSAELGSVTAAADALGYTPSAVSQLVTSLEKELGISLLSRSRRGVSVTSEGEGLIPIIQDYLSRENSIYEYAEDIRGLAEGRLCITAYPSVATNWLPDIMKQFKENYPGVNITILECIRSDIYDNLDSNEAELGFLTYAEDMPYEWIPLAEDQILAVLPQDHHLAGCSSYPIAEIEKDDFILTSGGQDPDIQYVLDKNHVSPEIKYATVDTPATLAMVQKGLGISLVNGLSACQWNEGLIKLPLDPPESTTFGIIFRSYDGLSAAARKFLDYAVRALTREERLL